MSATTLIAISILGLISEVVSDSGPKPLAPYFKACKKDAPDFDACCLASARASIPYVTKGDKTYLIPSFQPLKIEKIELSGPSLNFVITDVALWGLEKADIQDFKFDLKNKKIILKFISPEFKINGKYNIDGKILVLPLKGNGNIDINIEKPVVEYSAQYKLIKKGDYHYLSIDTSDVKFTILKASFALENLFEGNEQLSKSTHEVINKEWDAVIEELKPTITTTIKTVAASVVNSVASTVPYENMFL